MIIVSGRYDVLGLIELKTKRKTKTFVERISLKIDMDNIYIGNKLYLCVMFWKPSKLQSGFVHNSTLNKVYNFSSSIENSYGCTYTFSRFYFYLKWVVYNNIQLDYCTVWFLQGCHRFGRDGVYCCTPIFFLHTIGLPYNLQFIDGRCIEVEM